jgi:hypothetical protein
MLSACAANLQSYGLTVWYASGICVSNLKDPQGQVSFQKAQLMLISSKGQRTNCKKWHWMTHSTFMPRKSGQGSRMMW